MRDIKVELKGAKISPATEILPPLLRDPLLRDQKKKGKISLDLGFYLFGSYEVLP
jgi:hypothetical protein